MLVVFSRGLGFWLVCFLNCLGLAIKMTSGRHCKAEMVSLPKPNQLCTKTLSWPRTASHIPQLWRAEQSPGKLYRKMTASYSEVPLVAWAGLVTWAAQWPSTLNLNYPLFGAIPVWGSKPNLHWSWKQIMTWIAHSPHVVLALQAHSLG